ncbi:hypothetical protein CSE16_12440 [Solibacillus sp. R5-41]|uniref:hypothetical protein n=1 Tax=Solibacillus sp. R5-41 TaxID=2048654 RepID=UPI000C124BF2|nr:hypothetical protein [Solibacillus sp. R5-41]ATP40793.1 hypothetical protein CSE16_12440 [Solibacillus sp. R5-41]
MILKRGVTGFTAGDLSLERDWEAYKAEFKKCCYLYVQQLNGSILAWYEPDIDCNYAHAHVKIDGQELYIFHNHMYDYIAFTRNCYVGGLDFIDHSLLKALFENRYEVLTVYQLEEPLVRQAKGSGNILLNEDVLNDVDLRHSDNILLNENELNDVEIGFMNYFWSRTVGDLVFNYWD